MASSISSSKFPPRTQLTNIWSAALAATLCFIALVAFSRWSWFYDPTTLEKRIEVVERHAIAARPNAEIIILGTSRAAFGLSPYVIEGDLQLPAKSVANWSYPSFAVEAYEHLIEAHQSQIVKAELVVLCIDPYFGLAEFDSSIKSPKLCNKELGARYGANHS